MLGNLLGGFIVILIGLTIIPSVADSIVDATQNSTGGTEGINVTGVSATILDLTTIFFAIGIMSAGISLAVQGLKNAGMV